MLRIEKVSLQGFKSFCDPTEITFDEEGITAVVGPNGCGKSNISDAISWVIGEQRAKALRGGKMEDVIFQGSRNRPPSGMAEVMLTMVVHATFEIRAETNQPETEALRQAEESLDLVSDAIEASTADLQEENLAEITGEGEPSTSDISSQQTNTEDVRESQQSTKKRRKFAPKGVPRVFREGERIMVGRRLYRTGESEYEMNGRSCRLRDIQDLFAGTGLGGAHYAIIEQGRIGQVLSARPLDRRALIEEAAGISKFKIRQHAAELKLEASKQNLSRLTDILAEVERQQNSLKRQAGRARRYQRLKQEMRDLMRAVYLVDFRATRKTVAELESTLTEVSLRESQISAAISALEATNDEAAHIARQAEEALNTTRTLAAGIDLETERARQQHNYLNEQLYATGARSQQFAKDQAAIDERRHLIDQETARLRQELVRLEQEINSESKILNEAETEHRVRMDQDSNAERELEVARKQVYECVTFHERWRQSKRQLEDSVERSQSRINGLIAERERAIEVDWATEQEHAKLAASLDEDTQQQQKIAADLSGINKKLNSLRQLRQEGQERLSSLARDLTATEHRLKSLTEIERGKAYFSEAVQSLLNRERHAAGFKTLGTLADFVRVTPEHETMIETALRDELQYVVVPSFDDALGAIDFLKAKGAGRATFLVIGLHGADHDWNNGDGHYSQNGTLDSLLGLRPEFAEAFKLALPGLAKAKIVADTPEAISSSLSNNGSSGNGSLHPTTALSQTGERVVAGRLISGGTGSERGLGVLALKREIIELTDRMDNLTLATKTAESRLYEIETEIGQFEEKASLLDDQLRRLDKGLAVLREQLQQCNRERERAGTHLRVVSQEIAQAEEERKEYEGRLEHANSQTDQAQESRSGAEKLVENKQAEINQLRGDAELRLQELSRRRADFAARTERRRGLQNDIRRLENEVVDLEKRLNRSRLEVIEADDQTITLGKAIEDIAGRLAELTSQQQARVLEINEQTLALNSTREKLEVLNQESRSHRESAHEAREERARMEIERARLTSDLEHLINSCRTELGESIVDVSERLEASPRDPIDHALAEPAISSESEEDEIDDDFEVSFWDLPEDFDIDQARSRLDEVRAKIDALGPVNMMALEEVTEVEERFDFLSSQKTDIEKAIADTQEAIAEIKRRSRERFQEAFLAINENFKQMFQELFGGGRGEMRLIDETDLLESGIEIIAQPPGKRLQNVLLLSGGEKAMAALALVLAIFKYRPSPFCLLDEVDAPLDEVNIGRFVEKVVGMSSETQFVIITHSKRTMEAARTLYGVTMEDPGVSKLISVKLT